MLNLNSTPTNMTTQPPQDRKIFFLFPLALISLLLLGTLRILLDNLKNNQIQILRQNKFLKVPINVSENEIIEENCNVFEGKWVWDNVTYPLYKEETCPYLVKQVTCQRNGRPDSFYQNWRWQPHGCNLPRFNPLKMLEMLRDKRIMFIGDSIQRGMFESMVCLVQSVIADFDHSIERVPPRKIFRIEEFNASIEYYWAPFMVESISDHATNHTVMKRLVKLDSVEKHRKLWEGVDVLVFESYVWWMHKPFINATYGSTENVQEYNVTTAYKLALETWGRWIESNINPQRQKVFFATMSPTHLWNWEWKGGIDGNCFNETQPIEGPYWGTGSNLEIMSILKGVIEKLEVNVRLLNITQLSEYRKDGHTSVFGERRGKLLTKEERSEPKTYADCIHWCLPGVPDTWNQLLYAILLQDYRNH
ncbi:protein trichome birefringence-like 31 isoform X1 [Solanum pennellii]|uniref:Protein trichome birefringence-like 31 isoform X1 n=1 Tax=Solanum pennellii TaxID=28526 RepID=A0ABM1FRE6_SOLPN|nr:protein trichome birefringence-like 31 isoform X1 [Solanum pennellii]